jgi:hypothetical protein
VNGLWHRAQRGFPDICCFVNIDIQHHTPTYFMHVRPCCTREMMSISR